MRGMTSYAQAQRRGKGFSLEVVLRSTNSKYLEIFTHQLPLEKIYLEEAIKKETQKKIHRGRIEIYFFSHGRPSQKVVIDKNILSQYNRHAQHIAKQFKVSKEVLLRNFLMLPGIIRLEEKESVNDEMILAATREGLKKLIAFREKEGARIEKEIVKNIYAIEKAAKNIRNKTSSLRSEQNGYKDIAEEMALILFYINKLKKIVFSKTNVPQGKAVDFLAQELLRELNTASSKIKTQVMSGWLLEAKNALGRIKEQAQNIE